MFDKFAGVVYMISRNTETLTPHNIALYRYNRALTRERVNSPHELSLTTNVSGRHARLPKAKPGSGLTPWPTRPPGVRGRPDS